MNPQTQTTTHDTRHTTHEIPTTTHQPPTTNISLSINGQKISVPAGTMVAAAVALAGQDRFRRSITGEPRAPLCGMGICFECRLAIDGQPQRRSCNVPCQEGMEVRTDA